ncbi:MAG TPA: R3H domain-containing nucleic acid-binding protein [Ornithinimicrobium sp.]|nr:R3H domain-containing nucleic acid-binding protein [Ornithinimicrobium sp.]
MSTTPENPDSTPEEQTLDGAGQPGQRSGADDATAPEQPQDAERAPSAVDEEPDTHEEPAAGTADEPAGSVQDQEDGESEAAPGDPRRSLSKERTQELVREGEIAADFLEGLLDIADLSGDLEVDIENDRAAVAIVDSEDGAAPTRLVGPGGQVLDALQELTRLAVQAETGDRSRLMLDVAGYRSDRRAALVTTARRAVAEVTESGQPRELEPMTAFERKVVHDEVLAAGLRSESAGVEPSRYVVVLPS